MCAHLIADPTATATSMDPGVGAGWLRLSAAMTDEVPMIADREDLVVTIAPGAGQGSPACFVPAVATIEIDGTHLSVDPGTAMPHQVSDRARYATAWGLLVHECAHSRHSRWTPPPGAPAGAVAAALLLEESRIEAAHIRRRPDDRHWLRASTFHLVLADPIPTDPIPTDPAAAARTTVRDAAFAAALGLARVDAGILTAHEVQPVQVAVEAILGASTLEVLREIWCAALTVADDDTHTMIELGARWCAALGTDPAPTDPAATAPPPVTPPAGSPTPSKSAPGSGAPEPTTPLASQPASPVPGSPSPASPDPGSADAPSLGDPIAASALAAAVTAACGRVAARVAAEPVPTDPADAAARAARAERQARAGAQRAARELFTRGVIVAGEASSRATAIAGTRAPETDERTAARILGRALSTAGVRERVAVRTTSMMPPGRLRMRGALAADAQRAAGALPTAEPFTRTSRRPVPTPPLRLGVACDVSGSMRAFTEPVASAAWILAHAAEHARVPATTATVIFSYNVRAITRPGATPTAVTQFHADGSWEAIDTAIDALDGALDLSQPGAARLLVIVSDGRFRPDPRERAQIRINRLRASGCGILWLAPADTRCEPLTGATVVALSDPTATARAIGRAATAALRQR